MFKPLTALCAEGSQTLNPSMTLEFNFQVILRKQVTHADSKSESLLI